MTSAQKKRLATIEKRITSKLKQEKSAIFDIGKNLQLAKDILPKGQFHWWLSSTWKGEIRKSTSIRYLSIYNAFRNNWNKASEKLSTTVLYEISKTNFPKELRKVAVKNPTLFEGCSIRKLHRAASYYKEDKDLDKFIAYITTNLGENNELYQKLEESWKKQAAKLRALREIHVPRDEKTAFLQTAKELQKELSLVKGKV